MEIQSAKLIITVVDETTGELITREATLGDFKEVKKSSSGTTRTRKPKDEDPVAKITLLDNKLQLNNAAVQMTGFEPEMKIDVKFEKKGRTMTPVLCQDDKTGNRLTKTYTISFRGSRHDNLIEYGTVFELIPYEGKDGCFKLKGDAPEKEDDIIDLPEEINDPEEVSDDLELDSPSSEEAVNFDLEL